MARTFNLEFVLQLTRVIVVGTTTEGTYIDTGELRGLKNK